MPFFMDLHVIPGVKEEDLAKAHMADINIQDDFGVTLHTYWLNKETETLNCLYRADNAGQANAMHRASHGMEAEQVIEVNEAVVEAFMGRIEQTPAAINPATTNPGSGLRVILFTDMVGSTQMTQELGDDGAMKILRIHDAIVREALENHGGNEVKHTGDGIMASFASVAGAVNSTIEIQQRIDAYNDGEPSHNLHVKIGLSAGEPVEENADLFGSSVQLAARICDKAGAGEILVSSTVQDLCVGKGFTFSEREPIQMKGFATPTKLSHVLWANR